VELPPGPPVLSSVVAEVYGQPDHSYQDLLDAATIVADRLKAEPGLVEVDDIREAAAKKLVFVTDQEKAALAGVSVAEIAATLQTALSGTGNDLVRVEGERRPLRINLCQIAETLRLNNAFRPCLRRCWATTKHLIDGRTGRISISTWLEQYFDLRDCSHQVPASLQKSQMRVDIVLFRRLPCSKDPSHRDRDFTDRKLLPDSQASADCHRFAYDSRVLMILKFLPAAAYQVKVPCLSQLLGRQTIEDHNVETGPAVIREDLNGGRLSNLRQLFDASLIVLRQMAAGRTELVGLEDDQCFLR